MNKFVPGQEIETSIVAISNDCVFLNLNSKSEGVMEKAELLDKDGNLTAKEGDTIKVFFVGFQNGEMRFTKKISGDKADKEMLENAYKNRIPVEGRVEKEIKGGFEVKIGTTRAFCPFSQMGFRQKEEASFYVGKVLTFIIQEFKENGKNLLVSNRAVQEIAYQDQIADLQKKIKVGMTVSGTIESIQSYGAFVDIGGFRALLPVSEISRTRVTDIESVLYQGQKIDAQVIKTDWPNERVSLSLKALQADPWDSVLEDFSAGDKIDGTIARVADFGLFVSLKEGVDGLVHISELEEAGKNTNLRKVYNVGQKMTVIIKSIDQDERRISLTTATTKEEDSSASEYLSSQDDSDTYNPFAALLKK